MSNRGAYLGFVLVVLALLACKAKEGAKCQVNKDCKDNSLCLDSDTGNVRDFKDSKCHTYENAAAKCKATCAGEGRCALDPDHLGPDSPAYCAPASDDDCQQSALCKTAEKCRYSKEHGECVK